MNRIVAAAVPAALATLIAAPALAAVDGPKVAWDLSVWGPPRAFTAGIEALSKHVAGETGGKFTIKIHYGDALSKGPDNLDNIKLGAFEMAQICTGYHPGKNPAITVLDLPGLPLVDPDIHARVHDIVYKHPAIVAEFKRWNAVLLMSVLQPQSELMGTGEPPVKVEMFKGMRVRALGGTGDALRNLGAVPTSVPAPEVYNSLERGVFRAAAFPYTYAFAAYKIEEIAKWYTTNLGPGANNCPTIVNEQALNKLPPQYRALIDSGRPIAYEALKKAQKETDEKNLAAWQKRGLTAIKYDETELAKFRDLGARPVWDAWVKEMSAKNIPAKELLDLVVAEADKAKKALGR
ncbi:TRAP transporter substrate-binding protein DctP [Stella sp.]|uniref:TRAP transporter substrate-binding protein DctP n=1 Tax=Stella sp. TaxID=2912054 RepID=UPI0035B493F0